MEVVIIIFFSLLYDLMGTPLKDFNNSSLLARWSYYVCFRINKDPMAFEFAENKKAFVDYVTSSDLGFYKLLLCGYCQATWCLLAYHIYEFTNFETLVIDFAISIMVNTVFFKIKYYK